MIIEEQKEYLLGTNRIDFDRIIQDAHKIHKSFADHTLDWMYGSPMYMDGDAKLCFKSVDRQNFKKTDVTKYALNQAASIWGVPGKYLYDLYEKDMGALAVKNINELNRYNESHGKKVNGKVLVSEGTTEAVVSDKFALNFPVCDVLETVRDSIDRDRYIPNQVYLSKSKMHIRFVDFENREKVNGEDMSVGFTVDSSDVGKSALRVQFFIYKFACKNGIVRVGKGGTLYRQKHLGEAFTVESVQAFKDSFKNVDLLRKEGLDLVAANQNRMMSQTEMEQILDACRKNYCSISDKEREKIIDLAMYRYGRTKWGLINGITEVAQDHTLDDRLAYEVWAGKLLKTA